MNIKSAIRKLLLENETQTYETWVKVNMRGPLEISEIEGNLIKEVNPEMMISNFKQYSEIMSTNKIYKRLLNSIQPNECFTNSAVVMDHINDELSSVKATYVLGMIKEGGEMFGHAWNRINGKYYDFTLQTPESREYFGVMEFNNINEVTSLPMFDPDMKCAEALNVNGEAYDKDGMCSVYQYYKQVFN
jgi:hypothetical protein